MFHDCDAAGGLDDYNLYISQKDGFEHIQASSHYSLSNTGQSRPPVLAHKPLFGNFFSSCFLLDCCFGFAPFARYTIQSISPRYLFANHIAYQLYLSKTTQVMRNVIKSLTIFVE